MKSTRLGKRRHFNSLFASLREEAGPAFRLLLAGFAAFLLDASAVAGEPSALRLANLFETDDRQRLDRLPGTASGSIVLIVDPTTDKAGTGFMIAPCYMMSALHVVLSDFDLTARRYPSVRYEYTLYYGTGSRLGAFENFTVARPVAWGDYFDSIAVDASEDWIILQTEECIGRRYGHFSPAVVEIGEAGAQTSVALAGYPRSDDDPTVQADPRCRIRAERRWPEAGGPLWYHDCATRQGVSGAPIYRTTADGYEALAIAVGELQPTMTVRPVYSDDSANIAVPIGNAEWALTALRRESRGQIAEAQRLLAALGRGAGRRDGLVDSRTRMAIESYRSLRGLSGAGLVTEALIVALRADLAARAATQP